MQIFLVDLDDLTNLAMRLKERVRLSPIAVTSQAPAAPSVLLIKNQRLSNACPTFLIEQHILAHHLLLFPLQ